MPNQRNQQNSGNGLKTAATFGFGALVGAIAAGAAWYYSSEEEQRQSQPRQVYQSNHPVLSTAPPNNTTDEKDEKDEKDGTVKMCEICFVSFAELKECDIQIVSTPCGHVYCRDCIVASLAGKPECPHCRNGVQERDLRRLYL